MWKLKQSLAWCGGVLAVAASCGLGVGDAQAVVYFSDGFETQTDPLGNPPIGLRWSDNGLGNNHDLVASPVASGVSALRVNRDGSTDVPNLSAVGNAGALVAGNVVEFSFRLNTMLNPDNGVSHNFNSPIQINVGFSNGVALANFGTLNGGSENYFASNAGGGNVGLGVGVIRNTAAYDTIRLVLSLTEPAAGQLGGTYEVFIDTDDDDGLTTNSLGVFALTTQAIPVAESTNPNIRIARGDTTSNVFFDDVAITLVPEPGSMALATLGGVLLFARRRRSA